MAPYRIRRYTHYCFFLALLSRHSLRAHHLLVRTGFEQAFVNMVVNVYRFTILGFGLVMAAAQLGFNVGAALAGLGVLGLTLGFAAKDSLSNIMAGFLIFWDKPFHVGEWVTLGDHYGKIAEITMRTTRVQTRDNKWVIIPNATVIEQILVNHSANGNIRLQVPIGIGYADSVSEVRRIVVETIATLPFILQTPPPQVVLNDLASSSVNLLVFAWIAEAANEKPHFFALLEALKLALDRAGVELPFQQVDVRFRDGAEVRSVASGGS